MTQDIAIEFDPIRSAAKDFREVAHFIMLNLRLGEQCKLHPGTEESTNALPAGAAVL